jgi:hypothetical protein
MKRYRLKIFGGEFCNVMDINKLGLAMYLQRERLRATAPFLTP